MSSGVFNILLSSAISHVTPSRYLFLKKTLDTPAFMHSRVNRHDVFFSRRAFDRNELKIRWKICDLHHALDDMVI